MQPNKGSFTSREILSQPETWAETLKYLKKDWSTGLPVIKDYDEVILTGCGSTYFLSIWAARLLQSSTGVTCVSVPGSEIWIAGKNWIHPSRKTLLIAVSRSGRTTETLHALEYFKKSCQGDAVAITCYADSPLAKMAPTVFTTTSGMEHSVAQTRSFTNMMWPVILLAQRNLPDDLVDTISRSAQKMIDTYQETAHRIGSNPAIERFFFLGSGPLYGLALEVMLKMKEMSLSYSEAFHFLEFRHGPMSMVNNHSLIVGFTDPKRAEYELPVFRDMKKLGGQTLAVGNLPGNSPAIDFEFKLNEAISTPWSYPLYLPLIQLVAYARSISRGLNPDKPENLTAVVEL